MNALEKAHLIKELHGLAQQLEHKVLPLYEIARSKKEYAIFLICVMNLFSKPRFQHLKFALSLNLSPTNFLLTRLII